MIPTLIVAGLVFGRWWKTTLAVAAIGWPVWLVAGEVMGLQAGLLGAAALAVINTAVGVAVHQAVRRLVGRLRGDGAASETG